MNPELRTGADKQIGQEKDLGHDPGAKPQALGKPLEDPLCKDKGFYGGCDKAGLDKGLDDPLCKDKGFDRGCDKAGCDKAGCVGCDKAGCDKAGCDKAGCDKAGCVGCDKGHEFKKEHFVGVPLDDKGFKHEEVKQEGSIQQPHKEMPGLEFGEKNKDVHMGTHDPQKGESQKSTGYLEGAKEFIAQGFEKAKSGIQSMFQSKPEETQDKGYHWAKVEGEQGRSHWVIRGEELGAKQTH